MRANQPAKRTFNRGLVLLPVLSLFAVQARSLSASVPARARGPLSESEIVFLLKAGATPARVEALAERYGLAFALDATTRDRLRAARADDRVLADAIRAIEGAVASASVAPSALPTSTPSVTPSATPAAREVPVTQVKRSAVPTSGIEPVTILVRGGPRGDFAIAQHETSNAEFDTYCRNMGVKPPSAPFWGKPKDYPVVNVTWFDAVAYTRWLSLMTGRRYRLPLEGEWELAARGGITKRTFPWGDESPAGRACYGAGAPCARGAFPPTRPGLYDMAGGAAEWCADVLDPSSKDRTIRGGGWAVPRNDASRVAIDSRERLGADKSRNDVGFRVVREP